MQHTNSFLALLLASPVLVGSDGPALVHTEGQSVTRTWSLSTERSVESSSLVLMGNEQDIGSGSVRTNEQRIEVTDDVRAVRDGRASTLHRTYDAITTATDTEGLEETENMVIRGDNGSSALEGQGVVFENEAGEWTPAWDDDSTGEDEWLDDLAADMDLARLLPTNDDGEPVEVAAGDRWEVPAQFLTDVLRPGGTLQVQPEEDVDIPEGGIAIAVPSGSDSARWDELEGEVEATFAEITQAEDGPRLARIVVEVDLDGTLDIADELEDGAADRGADETYEVATIDRTLYGELVVMWNLDANRPESVRGKLESEEALVTQWTLAAGVGDIEVSFESESSVVYEVDGTWSE